MAEVQLHSQRIGEGALRATILMELASSAEARSLGMRLPAAWHPNALASSDEREKPSVEVPREWTYMSVERLAALGDAEMLEAACRVFLGRPSDSTDREHFRVSLHSGSPRILVLYKIACSPEAQSIGVKFPERWVPKTAQELLDLPAEQFLPATYYFSGSGYSCVYRRWWHATTYSHGH